ncbi:MAG: hypothetical protein K5786_00275 [Treponema sp.]|nr:hypothetical protein [Treponema sp.]
MDKRRNRKYNGNWNGQKKNAQGKDVEQKKNTFQFNHTLYEDPAAEKERIKAIQEVKNREVRCAKCGEIITDIASSIADKTTGKPVHFDCVLNQIKETEPTGENEKIAYIGQGRFAVLFYENMRDQRHFTIKKIIEWEDREQTSEWRDELSGLYSQIK